MISAPTLTKVIVIVALLLSSTMAVSNAEDRRAKWKEQQKRQSYIGSTRPHRLDGPLREENISDDEVRQIQVVTNIVYPGSIASIAGVTAGCPCEEGLWCDSQVWVLAYQEGKYRGFMLSRIDNTWLVGPIQEWWFSYDRLWERFFGPSAARIAGDSDHYRRYRDERQRHFERFPSCAN